MKASDFFNLVPDCCSEVLDAMYFTTVNGVLTPEMLAEMDIAPTTDKPVAFNLRYSGDISGSFGLSLEQVTAKSLAANFLGEEVEDISTKEVQEVVGELANMLCGSVMSRVEGENKFVLSHPEAVHSQPDSSVDDVLVSKLDTDGGVITVWVVVEGNTCPQ